MDIEQAEKRIKILLADKCNCSECLKNKEAMQTLLNVLKEKDKKIASKNRLLQIVGIELNEAETKIEEKDREIEKLKKHNKELLRKLRNRVKEVKELNKYSLYKKEFKTLNEQLKNKDQIIDLMAEYINEIDVSEEICEGKTMCDENCKECIKQYFESKAEKE